MDKKVSFLFLAEGFEEVEALTIVDVMRRANMDIKTISVTKHKEVKGAHGITVEADEIMENNDFSLRDWLILPGGMPGTKHLGECKPLLDLLQKQAEEKGHIAAICAATSVLGKIGILKGRKATCYPGFEDMLTGAEVTGNRVETDENIITGNGPASAMLFALAIVEKGINAAKAAEVASGMLMK